MELACCDLRTPCLTPHRGQNDGPSFVPHSSALAWDSWWMLTAKSVTLPQVPTGQASRGSIIVAAVHSFNNLRFPPKSHNTEASLPHTAAQSFLQKIPCICVHALQVRRSFFKCPLFAITKRKPTGVASLFPLPSLSIAAGVSLLPGSERDR